MRNRGIGRLKTLLKDHAARHGYRITRRSGPEGESSMRGALHRFAGRSGPIGTVIDVGASTGIWSRLAMPHFPLAHYLLIEAQPVHAPALEHFIREHPNAHMALAAAGPTNGTIYFDAGDPFSGRALRSATGPDSIMVPMATVDSLVERYDLPAPYLLKLDTHGFEVPILEGTTSTLEQAELVVIECYNFRLPDALLFHEMCAHMGNLGFRCIDLVDQMYRPGDLVLWQADLFFARNDNPVFERNEYL